MLSCAAARGMPFSLSELAQMSLTLRDVCLGIIDLTHPDAKPVTASTRLAAAQQLRVLAYVFRVRFHSPSFFLFLFVCLFGCLKLVGGMA